MKNRSGIVTHKQPLEHRLSDFANVLANERADLVNEAADALYSARLFMILVQRQIPSKHAAKYASLELQQIRKFWLAALDKINMTEQDANAQIHIPELRK
jgi:hypothetical protein